MNRGPESWLIGVTNSDDTCNGFRTECPEEEEVFRKELVGSTYTPQRERKVTK